MMHGITAVLLPCLVSGYALASANTIQLHLYDKPGANNYLRILLTGFLWLGICIVFAFLAGEDEYSWQKFIAFFESALSGKHAYLFGYGSTLAAVLTRRLILDSTHNLLRNSEQDYLQIFLLPFLQGRGKNMEIFLVEAISNSRLVVFVMKNDMVYVGWIDFVGTLKDSPEWLNIYPVARGRVDRESRAVKIAKKSQLADSAIKARAAMCSADASQMRMSLAVREITAMRSLDPELKFSPNDGF